MDFMDIQGETKLAPQVYQDEDEVSVCWPIPFSLKHAAIKRILGCIIPKEELCKEYSLRIYKDHFEFLVCLMWILKSEGACGFQS